MENQNNDENQEGNFNQKFEETFPSTVETTVKTNFESTSEMEIPHFAFDRSIPETFGKDILFETVEPALKLFPETDQDPLLSKDVKDTAYPPMPRNLGSKNHSDVEL